MNIGRRIEQRLKDLGWERKDLLDRVPELSPQALSNLIRRDSKRSEWDELIAGALGMSVLELVYGKSRQAEFSINEPRISKYSSKLTDDEALLIRAFRAASADAQAAAIMWARTVLPDGEMAKERTGTH